MSLKFPIFIENSRIPIWLSKVAPIDIYAIILGPFIICRGRMDERTRIHEMIHYKQYVELGFIGFPILYLFYWLMNLAKGLRGFQAYKMIPFELEAYENEWDISYPFNRKNYAWWDI
jgi:hypothetical protein